MISNTQVPCSHVSSGELTWSRVRLASPRSVRCVFVSRTCPPPTPAPLPELNNAADRMSILKVPSSAGRMFLLENSSQGLRSLPLTFHFAALRDNSVSAHLHSGIKKDEENYCAPRPNNVQLCVHVFFFFLIVKSCKQKSPPESETGRCLPGRPLK